MEIKKQNIHMNYEKASAMSQITLDDDYNLPDYRPDIVKVLKEKGEIRSFASKNYSGGTGQRGRLPGSS